LSINPNKGENMKRLTITTLVGLIFLYGCTLPIYKGGIEPIYPGVRTVGKSYETVESLTPTFRWKTDVTSPHTYDFAIWDGGRRVELDLNVYSVAKGPAVYYKEALSKPEHTVEIPLGPDSMYFWSVRIRSNGKVSAWAYYDYHQWVGVASSKGSSWPYRFKTPKVDEK
jgi:hypothetical protein